MLSDLMTLWLVPFLILHTVIFLTGYKEFNSDESSAIKRVTRTLYLICMSAFLGPFVWIGFLFFSWNVKRIKRETGRVLRW